MIENRRRVMGDQLHGFHIAVSHSTQNNSANYALNLSRNVIPIFAANSAQQDSPPKTEGE